MVIDYERLVNQCNLWLPTINHITISKGVHNLDIQGVNLPSTSPGVDPTAGRIFWDAGRLLFYSFKSGVCLLFVDRIEVKSALRNDHDF